MTKNTPLPGPPYLYIYFATRYSRQTTTHCTYAKHIPPPSKFKHREKRAYRYMGAKRPTCHHQQGRMLVKARAQKILRGAAPSLSSPESCGGEGGEIHEITIRHGWRLEAGNVLFKLPIDTYLTGMKQCDACNSSIWGGRAVWFEDVLIQTRKGPP